MGKINGFFVFLPAFEMIYSSCENTAPSGHLGVLRCRKRGLAGAFGLFWAHFGSFGLISALLGSFGFCSPAEPDGSLEP